MKTEHFIHFDECCNTCGTYWKFVPKQDLVADTEEGWEFECTVDLGDGKCQGKMFKPKTQQIQDRLLRVIN